MICSFQLHLLWAIIACASAFQAPILTAPHHHHHNRPRSLLQFSSPNDLPGESDTTDLRDISNRVRTTLDRAVFLYDSAKCMQSDGAPVEQLSSLIVYLATKLKAISLVSDITVNDDTSESSKDISDTRSTSQQIALEIDDALVRGDSLETIEALLEKFRALQAVSAQLANLAKELDATNRQLDAFRAMISTETIVDSSKVKKVQMPQTIPLQRLDEEIVGADSAKFDSLPTGRTGPWGFATKRPLSESSTTMLAATAADNLQDYPESAYFAVSKGSAEEDGFGKVFDKNVDNQESPDPLSEEVDIAIVGAGLGGLCAGAILNHVYGKKVGIYESHYLAGGCAHAFDRKAPNGVTFTFDSGPTILLGCSSEPYNALQQVLRTVEEEVEWIPYSGWGMIENPGKSDEKRWRVNLGPALFEEGPLLDFGGKEALAEFRALRDVTKGLLVGSSIPALAMRPGAGAVVPLLRFFPTLVDLIKQGETTTGTFAPFMDGPLFTVTNPWLRNWLDALAFSLSGLPASRTAAAAMAFTISDMHRAGAALDYPTGGLGEVVNALVRGVEKGTKGSKVNLRSHVESIDFSDDGTKAIGLTLNNGRKVKAREGVVCNAPVWTLRKLIKDEKALLSLNSFKPLQNNAPPPNSWAVSKDGAVITNERPDKDISETTLLQACDAAEMTGSFLHLHLALNATGLQMDELEAHYTVMDRSLAGNGSIINGVVDGPCGELNMIAVSNPCVIDKSLAPEGFIVVHAYGAGNEPYEVWKDLNRNSDEYKKLKEERSEVLWRAVESVIPDTRERVVLSLVGSPLTHERFLRRPQGTYGSATEDYLKDGKTPFNNMVLASDGIFPGIGLPAVAIAGASAANGLTSVLRHWRTLDRLSEQGRL